MIRVIDLDKTGWLENREFKDKRELRFFLMGLAKDNDFVDFKNLKLLNLSYFLEVYNLDLEMKGGIK